MGKAYQWSLLRCPGIIFPTPYPQGYGATPPPPRPAQSACDVPRSMPEAAANGNAGCAVHRGRPSGGRRRVTGRGGHPSATESHHRVTTRTVTTASNHHGAPGSGAVPAPAPPARPRPSPPPTGPRPPSSAGRSSAACPYRSPSWRTAHPTAMPPASLSASRSAPQPAPPVRHPPPPTGPRGRTGAVARNQSCAGRTTDSGTHNRIFSANFSPLSIPWRIGRPTPLPPGKKRPRGTLPPDRDGP